MLDKVKKYRPTEKEPFMGERQKEYFRAKLLAWKDEILKEAKTLLQHLQDENQTTQTSQIAHPPKLIVPLNSVRDRQRNSIAKIDAALQRIEDGNLRLL